MIWLCPEQGAQRGIQPSSLPSMPSNMICTDAALDALQLTVFCLLLQAVLYQGSVYLTTSEFYGTAHTPSNYYAHPFQLLLTLKSSCWH
mgnify:FL=1